MYHLRRLRANGPFHTCSTDFVSGVQECTHSAYVRMCRMCAAQPVSDVTCKVIRAAADLRSVGNGRTYVYVDTPQHARRVWAADEVPRNGRHLAPASGDHADRRRCPRDRQVIADRQDPLVIIDGLAASSRGAAMIACLKGNPALPLEVKCFGRTERGSNRAEHDRSASLKPHVEWIMP